MLPGMMGKGKKDGVGGIIIEVEKKDEMPAEDLGLQSAAEEIMSAIESKDVEALKGAMKAFHEMCMMDSEEGESESEME